LLTQRFCQLLLLLLIQLKLPLLLLSAVERRSRKTAVAA
jgi:hypothetical protein